jgi:hypothetical protein
MDANEIRTIRGSLSRPAFARLLGVTSLTVLRWELPSENKEARRPRARMVEELRRLAAGGVGLSTAEGQDDEEDDGASEPIEPRPEAASAVSVPARAPAASPQELRVLSLLPRLFNEGWQSAESELERLVGAGALSDPTARALAQLGLIQVQIIARLDVRGALAALRPLLDQGERGALPRHVAARVHVMAATLFGAPDARFFDPGRVNVHGALAEALLETEDDDLRVLVVMARASGAGFIGPHVLVRAYQAGQVSLERARGLLSLATGAELRAHVARLSGDLPGMERWEEDALERAERLGMPQVTLAILGHRSLRALRSGARPEEVLAIVARARATAQGSSPAEPIIRVLAAECEALARLARFPDSKRVLDEALALAAQHELSPLVLAMPGARLLLMMNRVAELEQLADRFAERAQGAAGVRSSMVELYVLTLRAVAVFATDQARSAELAGRACQALELVATEGSDFLAHDAYLILIFARLLSGDLKGAQEAMRSAETLYDRRPSLWHAAVLRRLSARSYAIEGRLAEAEQRLKAALASLDALGDVVHATTCRLDLALLAQLAGAPDAEARVAAANAAVERVGLRRPELPRDLPKELMMIGGGRVSVLADSLTERLANGVERLSLRSLSQELYLHELQEVLRDVFGPRAPALEHATGAASPAAEGEPLSLGDERFVVRAPDLNAEQRAALRTLLTVATLCCTTPSAKPAALDPTYEPDRELPNFIAAAPATRQLRREIGQLARAQATILITGESGSGKEVVAQALHDLSARADKPFIAFNCAAVPRDLFEGQLFGYRKGAFTGAQNDSPGVIRAADGGTLFLDEIGELPLELQPKLLRFLENGEVTPLGEQRPRRVSVRVLAATHRDLARLVREGQFREDLYYRLNVVPLNVPPLRERREDVVALARMFLARLVDKGAPAPELSADAVNALKAHSWPGNVRELRNVIERAMAYAPLAEVLDATHLRITGARSLSPAARDA